MAMSGFDRDKFSELAAKSRERFNSPRARKVLGFFTAKGFLISPHVSPQPQVKIKIEDVLWVGEHVEPRVVEVLPAAIIHYPRSFLSLSQLPQGLRDVIAALKKMSESGPGYGETTYHQFKQATQINLPDKRVVALTERKIARTFRLRPLVINRIKQEAMDRGISEAALIEDRFREDHRPR